MSEQKKGYMPEPKWGWRVLVSILVLMVAGWVALGWGTTATLTMSKMAGDQLKPNDNLYTNFIVWDQFFRSGTLLITLAAVVVLALIWVPFARWAIKRAGEFSVVLLGVLLLWPAPARAYFETADKTEAYTIMPNESAFWIPDVGDNKNSQTNLESEDYYKANKIAVKRFVITHHKLVNSGGFLGWDAYVPDGRLIIVDRSPYSREWVKAEHRGTSKQDQSFPCQSKEGINITVGMSIGASVTEQDSPKYLYRFGVTPPKGDRTQPAVIFTSVYYGRSLESMMDDVGRKKVQTLICAEITARTFDVANADANVILDKVRKDAEAWFKNVGVTLDFLGYADTFEFDRDVQKAVNERYVADKLGPVVGILQATTMLEVQRGLGKGIETHGLPVVVSPDILKSAIDLGKAVTGAK